MKYKRWLAIIPLIALTAIILFDNQTADNTMQLPQASTPQAEAPAPTNRLSSPTEFDETKYPDFYRIVGGAVINENIPPGAIIYSSIDSMGRTHAVRARLNHENYVKGQREREDISNIFPSGWTDNKKVKLSFADGTIYKGYFYNRSHLLAHSLGGPDKSYNMITGTRPQNVGKNNMKGGMQYTEMLAHDYLKNHKDGDIYYIATPLYQRNELVPRSIVVDMKSDDGSLNMEVEVYNAAPGYSIDYTTGEYQKLTQ